MREFTTGAKRDTDDGKFDYEGFLSPLVLARFAGYMHQHRVQADGGLRDSDNWQKGIPRSVYIKSAWRHFMAWWQEHRGYGSPEGLEETLCAMIFNAQGYLHEVLKEKLYGAQGPTQTATQTATQTSPYSDPMQYTIPFPDGAYGPRPRCGYCSGTGTGPHGPGGCVADARRYVK